MAVQYGVLVKKQFGWEPLKDDAGAVRLSADVDALLTEVRATYPLSSAIPFEKLDLATDWTVSGGTFGTRGARLTLMAKNVG